MKVEVVKRYVDRGTREICEVGSKLDYPDSRARELIDDGYAKSVSLKSEKQEGTQKKG